MSQALLTAVGLGFLGLVVAAVVGLTAADGAAVTRHISYGFFSSLITLLAHSMMMFYLIGKGKAVKEAMVEGGFGRSTTRTTGPMSVGLLRPDDRCSRSAPWRSPSLW